MRIGSISTGSEWLNNPAKSFAVTAARAQEYEKPWSGFPRVQAKG